MQQRLDREKFVIAVVGPSGAGKSTFINNVLKDTSAKVDHGSLSRCTETVSSFPVFGMASQFDIELIDTPGFMGVNTDDIQAMKDLDDWVDKSQKPLDGIVYLHDVSTSQPSIETLKDNFKMVSHKCRGKVIIGTTKWDRVPPNLHPKLETEFIQYCKSLTTKMGAKICPLYETYESARSLIDIMMKKDIVVCVMGPTKSGKSTLINSLLGEERMPVSHNLEPCTKKISEAAIVLDDPGLKDYRIILVDTPGVGEGAASEVSTFKSVLDFVVESARHRAHIFGGIIYLHDITDSRLSLTSTTILKFVLGDCKFTPKRLVFATTKWGRVPEEFGQQQENALRSFHSWVIAKGAQVDSFKDRESAIRLIHRVVDSLLEASFREFQQELVQIDAVRGSNLLDGFINRPALDGIKLREKRDKIKMRISAFQEASRSFSLRVQDFFSIL